MFSPKHSRDIVEDNSCNDEDGNENNLFHTMIT